MTLAKMQYPNGEHTRFPHIHWENDHGTVHRRWIISNVEYERVVFYAFEENSQPMFVTYRSFVSNRANDDVPKNISKHGSEFDTYMNPEWRSRQVEKLYYGPDPFAALEAVKLIK